MVKLNGSSLFFKLMLLKLTNSHILSNKIDQEIEIIFSNMEIRILSK